MAQLPNNIEGGYRVLLVGLGGGLSSLWPMGFDAGMWALPFLAFGVAGFCPFVWAAGRLSRKRAKSAD